MTGGRPLTPIRVELLGPLRLVVDGAPVDVPGTKRRAVLALLALAEGRIVTVDRLLDALWPSEVPESGRQALHSHVFRLRGHLARAADRLQTHPDGYRLELGPQDLDVAQARALLAAARADVRHDAAGALHRLRQADELWRGPVLADLGDLPPLAAAAEACAQLHREVTDALIAAGIAAGQASQVVQRAAESVTADPLREPAVLLLMRALAATGRAAEALRIGREYRHRLADETGLDPSPALGETERDVAAGAAGPAPASRRPAARPVTRLIGREAQVTELQRLLAAERLVTLVGPGGVGKTRVALEVARLTEAATVLPLAPVTDPRAVAHALASTLELNVVQGDVLSACVAVLGDRPGLLVIDNCEHLLDAVRDTVDLVLASCSRLAVLATSREPLGLPAECVSRLGPLPMPTGEADEDVARVPSVAVFLDRARRVRTGAAPMRAELPTVADIVRRLDGMPLAIELAAGRLSTMSLADLHTRLDRSLDLLGGGRPSGAGRHRTLRATIEWSYQLLSEEERRLFRQLSVFVDGVDLPTAEALAADLGLAGDPAGVLARLVDASMIEADFSRGTRYRLLETLRAFGADRLAAAGEAGAAADGLLRWAVELATWFGATVLTKREAEADAALRRELANLREAWRYARSSGRLDAAIAIVSGLAYAITYRDLVEMRGWAEQLADDPALATSPRAAFVLATAAEAVYHRGDYRQADRLARAGIELPTDDAGTWFCLTALAVADLARGAYSDAVEHSLAAAALVDPPRENPGMAALALAYSGDLERARRLNEGALAGAVAPTLISWDEYVRGEIDSLDGHPESAESHYLRSIELARAAGTTFLVGVATVGLLSVRARAGRVAEALRGYRDVIDYFARTGNWTHLWVTLRNLADLLRRLGDDEPAALLDAAADAAPDAPADSSPRTAPPPATPAGRAAVLEVARTAIERNLAGSRPGPRPLDE